jgi:peroxiredoxin
MSLHILLALTLLSLWVGFYQLLKQQGRILLKLDALERRQTGAADQPEVSSLAVGAVFPAFRIPDLAGKAVALEDFRGHQVLLVHWSPDCGFCDMIAPDLAALALDFEKSDVRLLLLAHGDAESNRRLAAEHKLTCPILLLDERNQPAPLEGQGTPSAYLLDADGRVADPCAVGAEEVPVLARKAVQADFRRQPGRHPLSQSQIPRDGLKAGAPAPAFRLPDLDGHPVALENYRGRRVLLVFSDPHCGPCDELAPVLARMHRDHRNNGLDFIMVGRGDAAENRRKASQHGIEFPVVIQEKWKLSKQYGIFATPVAFLVSEEGFISKDVAVGLDAITALAQEALGRRKGLTK